MITRDGNCLNFNHVRENATVRFCPACGELVNEEVPQKKCNQKKHTLSHRTGKNYCSDCGQRLPQDKSG